MRYVFILLTVFCTACGTALPTVKPYKLDVQQGNVVTSKMLLQLRPGMTKSQVRFIMGTPLVQDSFHGNRWDYVYQMREAGKLIEQRRVILDFENELLKSVRGDVIASKGEQAKLDAAAPNIGTRVVAPPAKAVEKSLLGKLKFWEKDAAELAQEAAEVKAKADAAAKNGLPVAPENAVSATPSIMAVPLEVQPALEPAAATPTPTVIPDAAPLATDALPIPLVAPEPAVAPVPALAPADDSMAVPSAMEVPMQEKAPPQDIQDKQDKQDKAPVYDSSSGMRFDRTLQNPLDDAEPVVSPKPLAPRVGNKTVPTPKDLPVDNETGMFDRMLEKIGF